MKERARKLRRVFAVPGWAWTHHFNTGEAEAMLYSVTDELAMRRLGLYQHQGKGAGGEVVVIVD